MKQALGLATACLATLCGCGGGGGDGGSTDDGGGPSYAPAVLYVDVAATGTGDGSSWANAYTDLSAALTAAAAGSDEVWVAPGTYTPSGSARTASFVIPHGVELLGGFDKTETHPDQRDFAVLPVLSGDIGVAADTSDNCYHVITLTAGAERTAATVSGFTISGGNADGAGADAHGGAILADSASLWVDNCAFIDNAASGSGGAIYCYGYEMVVDDSSLINNSAGINGGAIFLRTTDQVFADCRDTVFTGNSAVGDGGGLYVDNSLAPANWLDQARATVTRCVFDGNSADNGGGLYSYEGFLQLNDTLFHDNTATTWGGGLMTQLGTPFIVNCTAANNSAGIYGGGFFLNAYGGPDPSIKVADVDNCIMVQNSAGTAGADVATGGNQPSIASTCIGTAYGVSSTLTVTWDSYDPLFEDAANDDYRLADGSPAIDAGDDTEVESSRDVAGDPRIVNGTDPYARSTAVDLGCYENQHVQVIAIPGGNS